MRPSWLIAALIAMFAFFAFVYPNWKTFRYRMTIEISTPEGLKTGSSVIEIRGTPSFGLPQHGGNFWRPYMRAFGVSPIVDLGRHGWAVAALESVTAGGTRPDTSSIIQGNKSSGYTSMSYIPQHNYNVELYQLSNSLPSKELNRGHYPQFFWLPASGDLNRGRVFGAHQLPVVAGPKIQLMRITIEPTDDPLVTQRKENIPTWLTRLRGKAIVTRVFRGPGEHPFIVNLSSVERGF